MSIDLKDARRSTVRIDLILEARTGTRQWQGEEYPGIEAMFVTGPVREYVYLSKDDRDADFAAIRGYMDSADIVP